MKYPIVGSVCDCKKSSECEGLIGSHVYSIHRVVDSEVAGETLVEVMNPWNSDTWTGRYSDTSDLMTEELKTELGHTTTKSDGIYWMSIDDFVKYFCYVTVGKQIDNFRNNYKLVKDAEKGAKHTFTFDLQGGKKAWIGVSMIN